MSTKRLLRGRDRTGERYGRLMVIGLSPKTDRNTRWICLCDCGTQVSVIGYNLNNGHTLSCGCLQRERTGNAAFRHGLSTKGKESPEYAAYVGAKRRCLDSSFPYFSYYGGRGIKFLFSSYEEFLADVGMKPSSVHSLDRIDVNGNYEPGNCRWATRSQQTMNRRATGASGYRGVTRKKNRWIAQITHNGKNLVIGRFSTPEEAAAAYDRKALELRGEDARINGVAA